MLYSASVCLVRRQLKGLLPPTQVEFDRVADMYTKFTVDGDKQLTKINVNEAGIPSTAARFYTRVQLDCQEFVRRAKAVGEAKKVIEEKIALKKASQAAADKVAEQDKVDQDEAEAEKNMELMVQAFDKQLPGSTSLDMVIDNNATADLIVGMVQGDQAAGDHFHL